ncbi:MAG: 6-bladed beta-propeller [Candidatus Aminicenantes bacterium]|jgi:hypothetical protein
MKKIVAYLVLFFLFPLALMLYPQKVINNPDKPLKGTWDFHMEKLWEIRELGGEIFANIGQITSDNQETVYVVDRKNFKIFIIDKNGKLISSFGRKGEGPGEFKQLESCFLVNDQLVFPDRRSNRVHYFSKKGKFLKSVVIPNDLSPRVMVDENRLISVPYINWRDPKGRASGFIYNIKDKSKKTLFEFSTYKKGMVRKTSGTSSTSYSFSSSAITPIMVLGYNDGKLYYGFNNVYKITVRDIESLEDELTFTLEREKSKVPAAFKDDVLKHIDWPENIKREIKKGFPDYFTYFEGINCDQNNNIYVSLTFTNPDQRNKKKFDIFSPQGQYIYSAVISSPEDTEIRGSTLKGDKLYLSLETGEGDLMLVKYKIRLF